MKIDKKQLIFLSILILIGTLLTFFGVKTTYSRAQKTKDYVLVEGIYVGSSTYSSDEDGKTYTLTYSYEVDNKEYRISTDYGTGSVPKLGTKKNIKYNPNDPSEAVISGIGSSGILFVLGFMFITFPLIIIFTNNSNSESSKNSKSHEKLLSFFIGFVFVVMGGSVYYFICSGGNSLSLIYAFQTSGIWVIIPIIFIVVGMYVILASIFKKGEVLINTSGSEQEMPNYNYDMTVKQQEFEEKVTNITLKVSKISSICRPIFQIIGGLIFTFICFFIFILGTDIFSKFAISPFLICGIAITIKGIVILNHNIVNFNEIKNYNIQNKDQKANKDLSKFNLISSHLYGIGFLIFWFGFLIFFDYLAMKQINSGGIQLILFSLIFWLAGIYVAFKEFKK